MSAPRLGTPARNANAAFLGDGLVERGDAAACPLELRPQRLEGGAIGLLQISKTI